MINVTKTYLPDIEKYKAYIDRIYKSGWVTNYGELVQELESKLCKFLDVRNVILVSNGTIALQVLYKALELKGEVITTPFSFVATTSSIIWEGLKPVYADIEPNSLTIDPGKIEEKITDKTSAIVAVHVFSNPCDVETIELLAKKHDVKLIYDAAHAFSVKYNGQSVLNYGDASTLSFHATKIFHTIEGGAIISNDDALCRKIRLMINFGIAGYDSITELGINAKMNEFQAAMGLVVLEDVQNNIRKRNLIFDRYFEELGGNKGLRLIQVRPGSAINYSYFPVIFRSEEILLNVKDALNQNGIFPRRYFYPSLEELPYLGDKQNVPESSSIARRILCLPIYEDLEEDQVDIIIKTINRMIANNQEQ